MQGTSASLDTSRSIALRAGSPVKGGGSRDDEEGPEAAERRNGGFLSSVELNDWGVRVNAGMSTGSPSSRIANTSDNNSNRSSSTILLHAGSRVVLVAPQLAISHDVGAGIDLEETPSWRFATAAEDTRSGDENNSLKEGRRRGSGGLWSDGSALTGRAERRVLLQAGLKQPAADGNTKAVEGNPSSHISIQQSWIHVCAGRSPGNIPPLAPSPETDATATAATVNAAKTRGGGNGMSEGIGEVSPPREGLLVEVAGEAALLSTKKVRLRAGEEIALSSSDKTLLHSLHGMLLSTSPSNGEDVDGRAAVPEAGRAVPAAGPDNKRPQAPPDEQKMGHVILAPRTGSSVGIGSGFTSQDLVAAGADLANGRISLLPRPMPSLWWSPPAGALSYQ
ncbi:unnamed protein product [Hapterophycus canaliculatus]